MNNPVFPEGFAALIADAPDPVSAAGDEPAAESKYQRKKKRNKGRAVVPVEAPPEPRLLEPVEPVSVSSEEAEHWTRPAEEPSPQFDNGLPTDGGEVTTVSEVVPPLTESPAEWLRVTLHATVGGRGVTPAFLTPGVVMPWADPLTRGGNGWRDCRLELGIWRMARLVEPDGRSVIRALPDESTVLSVEGAPFGFGGARTAFVDCARATVTPDWLDVTKHPVPEELLRLAGPDAQSAALAAIKSIWPWFYLDVEEVENPKRQVLKQLAGKERKMQVVPVLPVCVLTEGANAATDLRLRSRLMDRVGHAALFVGLGDRMAPAGSSGALFADLPSDQMSVLDAWLQEVIDTSYSFDD